MPLPPFTEMPRPSGHQSAAGGHCRCSLSMDVCPSLTPRLAGRGFVLSHSSSFSVTSLLSIPPPSLLTPPHFFLTLLVIPTTLLPVLSAYFFLSYHVRLCFPFSHLPYLSPSPPPLFKQPILFLISLFLFFTSLYLPRLFPSHPWHIKKLTQRQAANPFCFCLIYYSRMSNILFPFIRPKSKSLTVILYKYISSRLKM